MINFPDSPAVDDIFTSGSLSWQWDGTKWKSATTVVTLAQGEVLGNPDATPASAIPADLALMLRASLGDGTAGYVITAGGTGVDPAWAAPSGVSLPSLDAAEVLGNDTASPATAAAVALLSVLRRALGDGVVGQAIMSGGPGADPAWGALKYGIGCFVPGVPTASQVLLSHTFMTDVTFPANFGSFSGYTSEARGTTAATATTTIVVQKSLAASPGSFSNVGTIVVSAGGYMASSFTTASSAVVGFAAGDTLQLVAPATPDATFAGFSASLVGYEV